ncbi:MAG: DUF5605 domain-containing protein [Oscillospiraceae bacterium]|nr:DUF5605 domain-containing protein [Oscillospiraceae bacterium]
MNYTEKVEKWGIFECSVKGKTDGNPFIDYSITAHFESESECKTVNGFYDGDGIYKVRFMPSFEGTYKFTVDGSFSDDKCGGEFTVFKPSENNHGQVRVHNKFHFQYADGTPYYPLGTTCYVWELQSDELIAQTLESLKNSPFNKIRFCVFPKHYCYNLGEPRSYPYEGKPMDGSVLTKDNFWNYNAHSEGNCWDFERFCPKHFQHIEYCISKLQKMNIEADIILFHPYDRWGFSAMDSETDMRYLKYVTARFSAYRNVWWSLANEYDFMQEKSVEHWNEIGEFLMNNDSYGHLRSIHNGMKFFDHTKPWVTHCSIQRQDIYRTAECTNEWREAYGKPVVLDEIAYEGNLKDGWGNISAQELVRRFWEAACRGGYGGHSETYIDENDVIWWSHGSVLKGESPSRIAFLKKVLEDAPAGGLRPGETAWDEVMAVPENEHIAKETGYHLFYYSFMRPSFRDFHFDDDNIYCADVIDTWNMTVKNAGQFKGWFRVELPGREFMAVRIRKR